MYIKLLELIPEPLFSRVGVGGRYEPGPDCLRFNAQFESGNLRKALWVSIAYGFENLPMQYTEIFFSC